MSYINVESKMFALINEPRENLRLTFVFGSTAMDDKQI